MLKKCVNLVAQRSKTFDDNKTLKALVIIQMSFQVVKSKQEKLNIHNQYSILKY